MECASLLAQYGENSHTSEIQRSVEQETKINIESSFSSFSLRSPCLCGEILIVRLNNSGGKK
jgi:hypothetical protein